MGEDETRATLSVRVKGQEFTSLSLQLATGDQVLSSNHQWYYQRAGMISDETVGPVSEAEFLQVVRSGSIALKTLVASPTRTKNQWVMVETIPGLLKTWNEGKDERSRQKQEQHAERERMRRQQAADRSAQKAADIQERGTHEQEQRSTVASLSDSQDYAMVERIHAEISNILTSREKVEFIAIQKKPLVNIKPDAVVATNRRLIFFRPKMLGQFTFDDYLWRDLGNAHVQQGLIGSKFMAKHIQGGMVQMDHLSKRAALRLYQIAQEREEEAVEIRRQRHMEEQRAGANQLSVQVTTPAGEQPDNNPRPTVADSSSNDLVKRLETLKQMLDKQLITQEEFDVRKNDILSEI